MTTNDVSSRENIAAQSRNYVQTNDVIVTIGGSRTVEMFLKVPENLILFKFYF